MSIQENKSYSYKGIWRLAFPIVIGTFAQEIVFFVDTLFLGKLGEIELGVAAMAGILYLLFAVALQGFGYGVQILTARFYGEKRYAETGAVLINAVQVICLLITVTFLVVQFCTPYLMSLYVSSKEILSLSIDFLAYRWWGLFFVGFNFLLRGYFVGLGDTNIITWSTLAMGITNLVLDYLFIFGYGSIPKMGVEGAALASVIAEGVATLFLVSHLYLFLDKEKFGLIKKITIDRALIRRWLNISCPISLQLIIAISAWYLFFILIEGQGEQALAISNVLRSILAIFLIPVWAFSTAGNSLVSRIIGEGFPEKIMKVLYRVWFLCFISAVVILVPVVIFRYEILGWFTSEGDSFIELFFPAFYMICISMLIFPFSMVMLHGIGGMGHTRSVLFVEIGALCIYMLYAAIVAQQNAPLYILWIAEPIYATALAVIAFFTLTSQYRAMMNSPLNTLQVKTNLN